MKIQIPPSPETEWILMYDQLRRLNIFIPIEDCPADALKKLQEACAAYGYLGLKIYAWVKLTADNEVSIAIDRLPDQKNFSW